MNFVNWLLAPSSKRLYTEMLAVFDPTILNKEIKTGRARSVENSIRKKLKSALNPLYLEVINDSDMHNVPEGSETHFRIIIVSKKFENMPYLKRHRKIHTVLDEELQNHIHSLTITAKAPSQWDEDDFFDPSPRCLGGFGL